MLFPERDKPIYEGILSEKPLSLLDLVQGNKGILVGGEKLLDVSYGGRGRNALVDFLWKRDRRVKNCWISHMGGKNAGVDFLWKQDRTG